MTAAETPFRCFPLLHGMSGSAAREKGKEERNKEGQEGNKRKAKFPANKRSVNQTNFMKEMIHIPKKRITGLLSKSGGNKH